MTLRLLFFCILLIAGLPTSQAVHSVNTPTAEQNTWTLAQQLDAETFATADRKTIERKIGKKLTLKERLVLKLAQRNVRKALKKGESTSAIKAKIAAADGDFNVGAFFLGFFLGLIGVLIAYIFMDKSKAKSAWIGLGVIVALVLILSVIGASGS